MIGRRAFLATLAGACCAQGQEGAPRRIVSRDGLLDVTLEGWRGPGEAGGRQATFFSFGRIVPAPLLEVRGGDTIRLRYTNSLSEPTNIHYHGLHVTPDGFGDNVFLEIIPGETLTYEFRLPAGHRAGTNWYHPHVHGRTARQLGGGMAGGLLVRGELDEVPEVAGASEHFLLLKDYGIYPDGTVSAGPILTVNGVVNPSLPLARGGMLRLRFLNASIDLYFRLRLEEHPFYVIATEGGSVPEPQGSNELLLAPGERVEVLVRGERPPGAYRLLNFPYEGQAGVMPGMPMGPNPPGVAVATIVYEGQRQPALELPSRLEDVRPLPPPGTEPRTFEFRSLELPSGPAFQINGRNFDHERVDTRVRLGTIEDWELVNLDPLDHPIHLHTNSFQILDADGQPERAWRDIINVPARSRRRFRVRFEDYPGRTVYHCHRVAHGDLGMMGVIEMQGRPARPPRSRQV